MNEFMKLNESKMVFFPSIVPMTREETVTGEIRHGMVEFPGNRTIPSLVNIFSVRSVKIIWSGHNKQPP